MKVTIDLDVTPQEARAFFGMPDVEPLNQMIMAAMMTKAKESMDTLADPERLVNAWMSFGGKGIEGMQAMMNAAMGAAAKKKG